MNYIWVAVGEASRLPVFASEKKYRMIWWLQRRQGLTMIHVYRLKDTEVIEVCVPCLLDHPTEPAKKRGHR